MKPTQSSSALESSDGGPLRMVDGERKIGGDEKRRETKERRGAEILLAECHVSKGMYCFCPLNHITIYVTTIYARYMQQSTVLKYESEIIMRIRYGIKRDKAILIPSY